MAEPARAALLFVLAALLVRAPALLFTELNWDEALYWQIAGELAAGRLPYTATWDRKPPGLFALLAPFHWAGGGSVWALRLGTALLVAATALGLHAIARRLLPGHPATGPLAGLAYVLLSMRGVGDGTNAELLLAPFAVGGIALALAARGHAGALGAGVLAGAALLVKQVALAEAAVAAGIVAFARPRLLPAFALGGAIPVAIATGVYGAAGHLGLLLETLAAAGEAGGDRVRVKAMRDGLATYAAATAAALAGLAALAWHGARKAALVLGTWLAAVAAMLLLLGRFADHMMVQLAPPLALGWASLAAQVGRALPRRPTLVNAVALLALLGYSLHTPARAAGEVVWQRNRIGVAHWGDRTATLAALLRPRIEGPHDLLVASRLLGLHRETGTLPATRFPFVPHLWSGYAPVDGVAEMARLLAARPGFVVVDDLWLPGTTMPDPRQAEVLAVLHAALAGSYVAEARVGRFTSRGGGFIGGGVGATIFRRADRPPP